MRILAIVGAVFLGLVAGGLTCVWLLVSSCESAAHRTFDGVTQTLKFPQQPGEEPGIGVGASPAPSQPNSTK